MEGLFGAFSCQQRCWLSSRWHSLLKVPLHSGTGSFWTIGGRNFVLFGRTACSGSPCSAARWEMGRKSPASSLQWPRAAMPFCSLFHQTWPQPHQVTPSWPRIWTTTPGLGLQFRWSTALTSEILFSSELTSYALGNKMFVFCPHLQRTYGVLVKENS